MLPDLPRLKAELSERLQYWLRLRFAQKAPLLAKVRHTLQHEGNTSSFQPEEGEPENINFKEACAEFTITKEEAPTLSPQEILNRLDVAAEHLASQVMKTFFEGINRGIEKVGNVVDGKGKGFTAELFLQGLETIQMDFNPDGTPQFPMLIVHPDVGKTLAEKSKEWESDPTFRARYEGILNQKYREWRDRENCRKLVD